MPNYTDNLNLKKPLASEHLLISDFNENADKIDANALNKMTFKGIVALITNLPSSANTVGDFYFVTEVTKFYVWNGNNWSYEQFTSVLDNPTLTGIPNAPTAVVATNTTQIATTAFVHLLMAAFVDSAPATLDTLNELAAALGDDPNFATTVTNALASKQPTLVSGTNIKTINSESLLGSTNIEVLPIQNNTGFHNSIYRGKYLGTSVTPEQYTAISSGECTDLYIGDYWTIGGVNWRIAGFDYFYNVGDTNFATHHAVIVPDTTLYSAQMNTTNITTGAYSSSLMRTTNLASAISTISGIFGTHLKTHRQLLANAVSGEKASGWSWYDASVGLMNEVMVYGASAWGESAYNNGYQVGTSNGQLPLFSLRHDLINTRQTYWLRDVVSSTDFALVNYSGHATNVNASISRGVRPAFCIS